MILRKENKHEKKVKIYFNINNKNIWKMFEKYLENFLTIFVKIFG